MKYLEILDKESLDKIYNWFLKNKLQPVNVFQERCEIWYLYRIFDDLNFWKEYIDVENEVSVIITTFKGNVMSVSLFTDFNDAKEFFLNTTET